MNTIWDMFLIKKEKKYNPIRLLPENGNYKGYISIKKGEKILATLKKAESLTLLFLLSTSKSNV